MDYILFVNQNGTLKSARDYVEACYEAEGMPGAYEILVAETPEEAIKAARSIGSGVKYALVGGDSKASVCKAAGVLGGELTTDIYSTVPLPGTTSMDRIFIKGYIDPEDPDWDNDFRKSLRGYKMGLRDNDLPTEPDEEYACDLPGPGILGQMPPELEPSEVPEGETDCLGPLSEERDIAADRTFNQI